MEIKCGLTSRGKFNFPFLQTCFTIKLSLAFPVNYIKCITFPPNQNVFINILLLKLVPFGQKGKGGKGENAGVNLYCFYHNYHFNHHCAVCDRAYAVTNFKMLLIMYFWAKNTVGFC